VTTNLTAAQYRAMPLADLFALELAAGHAVARLEDARKYHEADKADEEFRLIRRIRQQKNNSAVVL
jgi:hypothetical protein